MGGIDDAAVGTLRESLRGAVITPPDVISMLMMLVPLIILYEIAIIAIRVVVKVPPAE